MASTSALTKPNPVATLRELLNKSRDQIAMALPRHMTAERLIRVALTAVQRTPALMECDQLSIVGAVVQASQLGLEPDGILGHAYLVPFFNKKTQRKEAQLQIGYRGFIALARRSGDIQSISAHVVFEKDKFNYAFGLTDKLEHTPSSEVERGHPTHAWALVKFKDNGYQFDVMTASEIEAVRECSKAKDDGPWQSHWNEMAKKSVIRRLAKLLPMSIEESALVRAAVLDEYADAGVAQSLAAEVESSEAVRMATEARAEEIKEKYRKPAEEQSAAEQNETTKSSNGKSPLEQTKAAPRPFEVSGKVESVELTANDKALQLDMSGLKLFTREPEHIKILKAAQGLECVFMATQVGDKSKMQAKIVSILKCGAQEWLSDGTPVIRTDADLRGEALFGA